MSDQTLEFLEGFAMMLVALVVAAVCVSAILLHDYEGEQAQRLRRQHEPDGHQEPVGVDRQSSVPGGDAGSLR